ncbi:MAG: Ppx/GppA family phosphatase [Bacteroidales bacterium]|nr:Ppx/GppA family phosphatase [Bacteroidales bacterium]
MKTKKKDFNPDCFNLAAIDIGSNAARLLIKSVTRQDDGTLLFQKQQFVRVPLRLGMDVFHDGKISDERAEQFIRMIKAFRQLMIIYKVVAYRACATSALRDAENGEKIIKHIQKEVGVKIEIISGDEEAETIYNTHIEKLLLMSASNTEEKKSYLYVDVGGGSTEVSFISEGQLKASHSFNIGTLRMLSGLVSLENLNAMCDEIVALMQEHNECAIIGSGGNINKLFRLVPKKQKLKDRITLPQLEKLYGQLASITVEERMREFDLRADRADVIVPAAQIFINIAKAIGATDIIVPTIGLADGIINNLAQAQTEDLS